MSGDRGSHSTQVMPWAVILTAATLAVIAYSGERDRAFRLNVTAAHEMVLRG